jgi:hypothetical protein
MTWPATLDRARIDLSSARLSAADAERQMRTATEILRRLDQQPGLILADEVGMGKTFVALATAFSAAWADKGRRPVVIMVPTSVQAKWERDFAYFQDHCIKSPPHRVRLGVASNALDFFRLLDDPLAKRCQVILLAHGSFHRNLRDPWVKLAILKFALHHAKLGERRQALPRFAAEILQTKSQYDQPELFEKLLARGFDEWKELIGKYGAPVEDDPVPAALHRALERSELDLVPLRQALLDLPLRASPHLKDRLKDLRQSLNDTFQRVWHTALTNARFRSPLLILDEAHHVKNPATKLASLFVSEEGESEAKSLAGALAGGFERMVFLTATPFQLGHDELLDIIDRFRGIDWRNLSSSEAASVFATQWKTLRGALDEAQQAALELDARWGLLRPADLPNAALDDATVSSWWTQVQATQDAQPERIQQVVRAYTRAQKGLRAAELLLRPWVIRHLRARTFVATTTPRRTRLVGDALRTGQVTDLHGLPIRDDAMLPFLLAARAQAMVAHVSRRDQSHAVRRATFADGLASCYETFLETSRPSPGSEPLADEAVLSGTSFEQGLDPRLRRYLDRLRESLPSQDSYAGHPKVAATVNRVAELWSRGEKVVVFCHFRVTGRALLKHLSAALAQRLWAAASMRTGLTVDALRERANLWSDAFDPGRPLERTLRLAVSRSLEGVAGLTSEQGHRVNDIVRRFVRTPLYLGRFVDLASDDRDGALAAALEQAGTGVAARLADFSSLLRRLTPSERDKYCHALETLQSGTRYEVGDGDSERGAELLPNVRLASGGVTPDARERLLLAFNTPFFPEVLVASSVMAEGVDLHLQCRHIIHHDLDWNPSTLEQRTGRVDRINSLADRVGQSIEVGLPYIGGTQDEKMYRVVMDRERWFQVVMGESFKTDEHLTDALLGDHPKAGHS